MIYTPSEETAVSYTHLDVYKRQVLCWSIKTLIDALILPKGISQDVTTTPFTVYKQKI